jgi:hypothetical protein
MNTDGHRFTAPDNAESRSQISECRTEDPERVNHGLTQMGGQMVSGTEAGTRRGHPQIPQITQIHGSDRTSPDQAKSEARLQRLERRTADRRANPKLPGLGSVLDH